MFIKGGGPHSLPLITGGGAIMKELMSLQDYLVEEFNNITRANNNDSREIVEVELYVHELRRIIEILQDK